MSNLNLKKILTVIKKSVIVDFPKKGINFIDIRPILEDKNLYRFVINELCKKIKDFCPDVIIGIESRGFVFASVIAYILNVSFVLIRKKGKLPFPKIEKSYALEYGFDTLEIQANFL